MSSKCLSIKSILHTFNKTKPPIYHQQSRDFVKCNSNLPLGNFTETEAIHHNSRLTRAYLEHNFIEQRRFVQTNDLTRRSSDWYKMKEMLSIYISIGQSWNWIFDINVKISNTGYIYQYYIFFFIKCVSWHKWTCKFQKINLLKFNVKNQEAQITSFTFHEN